MATFVILDADSISIPEPTNVRVSVSKSERDSIRAEKAAAIVRDQLTIAHAKARSNHHQLQIAPSYSRSKQRYAKSYRKACDDVRKLEAKLFDISQRLIVE